MRRLLGKTQKAFTLLETLVALFVFILGVDLMQTELKQVKQVVQATFVEEDIRWHLAVHQLDHFIAGAVYERQQNNKIYFYQPNRQKHYRIEPYKNMIRLAGTKQGHMPLLLGVKHATLSYHKPFIQVTVTALSGQCYQNNFYLPVTEARL